MVYGDDPMWGDFSSMAKTDNPTDASGSFTTVCVPVGDDDGWLFEVAVGGGELWVGGVALLTVIILMF
jgi:hypothetical protein